MSRSRVSFSPHERNAIAFISSWYREDWAAIKEARRGLTFSLSHPRNQEILISLVNQGCDKELILAASVLLAKPAPYWRRELASSVKKQLGSLLECASTLEHLFESPNGRPNKFFPAEVVRFLQRVPEILRDYETHLSRSCRNLDYLESKHFVRRDTLKIIGNHLKEKTGQYHWEVIADFISEFTDKTPSSTTLEKAYRRANREFPESPS